ncbi:NUDIX domain-containing protein [Candidatus Gracilibacteria bacterium]|nr:NUDIX domain-containing protein [Candidatus Gracilibacteria bacterium]
MQERFDIVDINDTVIKTGLLESELHVNNDITRVVTIHIQDSEGNYYTAQRSPNKQIDPLKFEASAHGRVNSGEDYEIAARREVLEEMGVRDIELQEIAHFYMSFDSNVGIRQHWKKLYIGKCKKLGKIEKSEIYALKKFESLEKLLEYFSENTEKFSNAVAFDIPYLENFLSSN